MQEHRTWSCAIGGSDEACGCVFAVVVCSEGEAADMAFLCPRWIACCNHIDKRYWGPTEGGGLRAVLQTDFPIRQVLIEEVYKVLPHRFGARCTGDTDSQNGRKESAILNIEICAWRRERLERGIGENRVCGGKGEGEKEREDGA